MTDDLGRNAVVSGSRTDRPRLAHHGEAGDHLMADQSDVEIALVNAVSAALYPNGTSEPAFLGRTAASIAVGRIRRRWMPIWRPARSTSPYSPAAAPAGIPRATPNNGRAQPAQPTLTVAVDGTSVTFGGSADVGQIAGILVDGASYAYRTQAGDTPQLVAANLAAMARSNIDRSPVVQHA